VAGNPAPALDRPWRRPGALRYALGRLRGIAKPPITVTAPPPDILVERDVGVPTRDGTVLRINVCRKGDDRKEEARPVILSIHPYGKDNLPKRRGKKWTFSVQYRALRQPQPVTFSALTGWEAPDPVWWTAQGFTVVNADARGCGHSEGIGKLLSRQEAEDTYDLVQWIAGQPWCDGNVVMLGVSYLAITQYAVAALQPPALRAICPWEGWTDAYRDLTFPGGVREFGFTRLWSRNMRRDTRQTYDLQRMQEDHPLRDDFWRSVVPDLSAIKVPMLVCGSFSDNNLHSRGSIRAFTHGGSAHARLYTHRGGKWATFYSEAALAEQLKFFHEVLDGAPDSRSVRLEVRADRDTITAVREEAEWPLARTRWQSLYLGGHLAGAGALAPERPTEAGSITFETVSSAAAFSWTVPADIELTGPMAARLWVELDGSDDANLFVGVEKWCDGRFVGFEGSYGYGRDRITTGWQRVSLRALDPELSQPWEPVPVCADPQPLSAGDVVAVDVALGPSATLFRAGEQLRLVVAGRWLCPKNPLIGQMPAAYEKTPRGRITLHWGPRYDAHLLIPEIP
jgi:putative CocE/NonD family hydrolase